MVEHGVLRPTIMIGIRVADRGREGEDRIGPAVYLPSGHCHTRLGVDRGGGCEAAFTLPCLAFASIRSGLAVSTHTHTLFYTRTNSSSTL